MLKGEKEGEEGGAKWIAPRGEMDDSEARVAARLGVGRVARPEAPLAFG